MNHDVWKTFAANEVSHSMAHYLTTIHELREGLGYARISDVARDLEVTKGSVSVQIKHLKERGLVTEDGNRHLSLSEQGSAIAREVLHNRRVLLEFIQNVLGIRAELAEADACKIEHLLSRETSEKLLAFVALLQSEDPDARKLLKRHKSYQWTCPSLGECRLCDDQCLVEVEPCRLDPGAAPPAPRAR